jgi:hypothetical protein
MEPLSRPLVARLHEIPDPRYPRGRRHPLAIERRVTSKKGGEQHHEVVYGVSSLGPDRAGPERYVIPSIRSAIVLTRFSQS